MAARLEARPAAATVLVFGASLFMEPGPAQALVGFAVLGLVAWQDAGALRCVGRLRFWLFPALFFALAPLFVGTPDWRVAGRPYSLAQFRMGAAFLLHAYVFTAVVAWVSRNVSAQDLAGKAESLGFRRFGLRLALALIATKLLRRMLVESFGLYRRQRPRTGQFLRDLPVLAGAVVGNCARLAEDIAVLFYIRGVRV